MGRVIEVSGKNVEAARQEALRQLNLSLDQVEIEVLDEGNEGGFLGLGRRPALIRVSEVETQEFEEGPEAEVFDSVEMEHEPQTYVEDDVTEDLEEMGFFDDAEGFDDQEPLGESVFVDQEPGLNESEAEDSNITDEVLTDETNDDEDRLNEIPSVEVKSDELTDNSEDPQADLTYRSRSRRHARHHRSGRRVETGDPLAAVQEFVGEILRLMHSDATVNLDQDDENIFCDIEGDDCGILIGRQGETLMAIQYLASLAMVKKTHTGKRLRLDIGGYHRRRKSSLVSMAKRTAKRALQTGSAFELNPMKPSERRVIHEALQGMRGIYTYSEGEEPDRYVVIDLEEESI